MLFTYGAGQLTLYDVHFNALVLIYESNVNSTMGLSIERGNVCILIGNMLHIQWTLSTITCKSCSSCSCSSRSSYMYIIDDFRKSIVTVYFNCQCVDINIPLFHSVAATSSDSSFDMLKSKFVQDQNLMILFRKKFHEFWTNRWINRLLKRQPFPKIIYNCYN